MGIQVCLAARSQRAALKPHVMEATTLDKASMQLQVCAASVLVPSAALASCQGFQHGVGKRFVKAVGLLWHPGVSLLSLLVPRGPLDQARCPLQNETVGKSHDITKNLRQG